MYGANDDFISRCTNAHWSFCHLTFIPKLFVFLLFSINIAITYNSIIAKSICKEGGGCHPFGHSYMQLGCTGAARLLVSCSLSSAANFDNRIIAVGTAVVQILCNKSNIASYCYVTMRKVLNYAFDFLITYHNFRDPELQHRIS